jgi:hypothetical protein
MVCGTLPHGGLRISPQISLHLELLCVHSRVAAPEPEPTGAATLFVEPELIGQKHCIMVGSWFRLLWLLLRP